MTDAAPANSALAVGARIRIPDGVHGAGRMGKVVGQQMFVGQWWCPVLWDGDDDPECHKSSCLEAAGPPGRFIAVNADSRQLVDLDTIGEAAVAAMELLLSPDGGAWSGNRIVFARDGDLHWQATHDIGWEDMTATVLSELGGRA